MRYSINTVNTKHDQLANGSFKIGGGSEIMLIVGSCRTVPYVQYLDYLNAGKRFTIHFIDPYNWIYDAMDRNVPKDGIFSALETDRRILDLLGKVKWYVHEHYRSYGMFNSTRDSEKHIYQFGMNPEHDILIPNFNDVFLLFQDFANFDAKLKEEMKAGITPELRERIAAKGMANLGKFFDVCGLTSFPQMADVVRAEWRLRRYFWNSNHVANNFTIAMFRMLNNQFLRLDTDQTFWARVQSEDMYSTPHTPMTSHDVEAYGLQWNEPVVQLKL